MSERQLALEEGELTRLAEATKKSLTHLHFVLRGLRQPAPALAEQLEGLGHPVWDLYPELKRPEAKEEAGDAA